MGEIIQDQHINQITPPLDSLHKIPSSQARPTLGAGSTSSHLGPSTFDTKIFKMVKQHAQILDSCTMHLIKYHLIDYTFKYCILLNMMKGVGGPSKALLVLFILQRHKKYDKQKRSLTTFCTWVAPPTSWKVWPAKTCSAQGLWIFNGHVLGNWDTHIVLDWCLPLCQTGTDLSLELLLLLGHHRLML